MIYLAVLNRMGGAYETEMAIGAATYAAKNPGIHALYLTPHHLKDFRADGVVGSFYSQEEVPEHLVAVNVSNAMPELGLPSVISDDLAVGRLAARHLRSRGYAHFAWAGKDDLFAYAKERRNGFEEVIGAQVRATPILEDYSEWLSELPLPVGIFCDDDHTARKVLNCAAEKPGLVPGRIGVVGVNNDELICSFCRLPLTSVSHNGRRVGYEAARLAVSIARGGKPAESQLRIDPLTVVVRASTELMAAPHPLVRRALTWMQDHHHEGGRIEELTHALCVNRRQLERVFVREMGCTPALLLREFRLESARNLLVHTRLSVEQVALESGFHDPRSLLKSYRQAYGMAPLAYRARHSGLD